MPDVNVLPTIVLLPVSNKQCAKFASRILWSLKFFLLPSPRCLLAILKFVNHLRCVWESWPDGFQLIINLTLFIRWSLNWSYVLLPELCMPLLKSLTLREETIIDPELLKGEHVFFKLWSHLPSSHFLKLSATMMNRWVFFYSLLDVRIIQWQCLVCLKSIITIMCLASPIYYSLKKGFPSLWLF